MTGGDRSLDWEWGEHELFVETAPEPQEITCPGCGEQFPVIITETSKVAGESCPACNAMIYYKFSRGENKKEDTTEQTTLLTDGGTTDTDRCGSDLGPPRCDVYGCEKYAPVEYTDGAGKRCLDCLDMDRDMGEVPTP